MGAEEKVANRNAVGQTPPEDKNKVSSQEALDGLRGRNEYAKVVLAQHFRDRSVDTLEGYNNVGGKIGISLGHIADNKNGQRFMIKYATKKDHSMLKSDASAIYKDPSEQQDYSMVVHYAGYCNYHNMVAPSVGAGIQQQDYNMVVHYAGYYKDHNMVAPSVDADVRNQNYDLRMALFAEFVIGPIYRRLLFDRAPIIELVMEEGLITDPRTSVVAINPNEDVRYSYIRSKFMDGFQSLKEFSGNVNPKGACVNNNPEQLQKVVGFEKVMAASLMLGEADYHAENIGVIKKTDELGNDHYIAVKIDHGSSVANTFESTGKLREEMIKEFVGIGYLLEDGETTIPFSANKLKESIDEMLKVSEEEITNIIHNRFRLLEQAGCDFKNNIFPYYINDMLKTVEIKKVEDIIEVCIDIIKRNMGIMREFSDILGIIVKSNAPADIKNGGWLASLGTKDVIIWALKQGYTIEGKNPMIWALKLKNPREAKALISSLDEGSKQGMLTSLLRAYEALKEIEGVEDELTKLESIYEIVLDAINTSAVRGVINKYSPGGKIFSSAEPDTVAEIIHQTLPTIKPTDLTSEKLMQSCSLNIVYKMAKVAKMLDEKQQGDGTISVRVEEAVPDAGSFAAAIVSERVKKAVSELMIMINSEDHPLGHTSVITGILARSDESKEEGLSRW